MSFPARPALYSASPVSSRISRSGHGEPSGLTKFPSTIAYGLTGASSTAVTVAARARLTRCRLAAATKAPNASAATASHFVQRRRGAGEVSGIPVDLGGVDVSLPVPPDVLPRQVKQDLVPRDAAGDGLLNPIEND